MKTKTNKPPKAAGRSDHFQTPDWPVDALVPYLKRLGRPQIWESAQGKGQIVRRLEHHEFDVVGTDVMHGFDFLSPLAALPDFDVIVTNPPYSVKDEWLQRCFDIGKPFALLLPVTAFGEQERYKMYKKYGIEILLLPKRINFETPSGKKGKSWFYCAWFCWQILPEKICFAD